MTLFIVFLINHLQNKILDMTRASGEKAMTPHSSILAWKIPWMEEPGRLQSMGTRRVGRDWVTSLSLFTFMHWRGSGNPLQCYCLENPREGGAWWAAVHGVSQSWTWLKQLSSSSSCSRASRDKKLSLHDQNLVGHICRHLTLGCLPGSLWNHNTVIYNP